MKLDPNQFMTAITNSVTRRMDSLFPGYFSNAKHDHYGDFGYPYNVDDTLLRHVYRRNSLARAAVVKTVDKVWQDMPVLREKESAHAETRLERRIRQHMQLIRGWQMLKVSNERALVSGWSATILLLEDGESLSAPVSPQVGADITFLAGMLPVWANQLQPVEWERNENSPTYGQPTMYMLTEQPLPDQMQRSTSQPSRKVEVHPDRVVVWSPDGKPTGSSILEAGYNDLIDIEKINGSGGEGFWKNTKGGAVLKLAEDMEISDLQRNLNATSSSDMIEKMNTQLDDFAKGLDKALVLQNMDLEVPNIVLPSPEHFRNGPLEGFAASVGIPIKVLVGTQTGERSSTEDAREWAQTCMARRKDLTHPVLYAFVSKLESFGLLQEKDWFVEQPDLTEATQAQKVINASTLSDINHKAGETVFTIDELREAAGKQPMTQEQKREAQEADKRREQRSPEAEEPRTKQATQPDTEGERMNP
jgi:hypothetical protein